ncbi:hypothetical protein Taro_021179 [Colocasia esculenta]|uniref:DUF1771 domain-containing protein n=1 Tax=Colocasia esculenta TaxID=4460 RepID=A0A843UYB7_COLES|nr:hypothetical protein [Colocasia esculenta]
MPQDRLPILGSQHSEVKDLSSAQRKSSDSYSMNKSGSDFRQEVLESLFCAPKRFEETPKRAQLQLGLNRTRVVGQKVVSAPLDDVNPRPPTDITKEVDDNEDDSYPILRRAAKQSWDLMKRYYEAAVDAFNKGDRAKADYLIEQGKHYNKMAREADENSARKVLDSRNVESENDFVLDLHTHDAKNGVKLLKCHLRSLAGIPCK